MTRVKICGITNIEDATAAIEAGADALGFILVPESPRYVGNSPEVLDLMSRVPPFVSRVAVCRSPEDIPAHWRDKVDAIQFYEYSAITAFGGKRAIRAFRMRDEESVEALGNELSLFRPDALLLDTYQRERLGGCGETFDWSLARLVRDRYDVPLVLAGGLSPENVADAVRRVRPHAVDVSSGVERSPGRKDHAKLRAFLHELRNA